MMMPDFLKAKRATPTSEFCHAEQKLDGHRVMIGKDSTGKIHAKTRVTDSMWDTIDDLECVLPVYGMPANTVIDAELWIPGVQATSVKTHIISKSKDLRLSAFALPMHNGLDKSQLSVPTSRAMLVTLGFHVPPTVPLSESLDSLLASAMKGWEGLILKQSNYQGWWKLKHERTVDCVVTGFTKSASTTKYGWLKAVHAAVIKPDGTKTVVASVGTGFTDDFREKVNPETLIGKVCEVRYQDVAALGQLKFPRFIRWRDDKNPSDCTADQLEEA